MIIVKLKRKSDLGKKPLVFHAKHDQRVGLWLGSASSSQERPETGLSSAIWTRQMSSVETCQMSAVETLQVSVVVAR